MTPNDYAALDHDTLVQEVVRRDNEIAQRDREIQKLTNSIINANKARF